MAVSALPLCGFADNRPVGKPFLTRSEIIAQHGMACTSQPLATQAAIDILKRGGTAVDAAIAANAVLGLTEPMSCGIGGDLFAIVWDAKSKRLHGLNASGRSPYLMTVEDLKKDGLTKIPAIGPLPVTIPGCVDGWFELHKKFGKLSMKTILAPAIGYARDGFPVSEVIAAGWPTPRSALAKFPNFKETYCPDGKAPRKGEIFKNPDLGRTLDKIARGGRNAYYKGDIARAAVTYLRANGGFHTERDYADHRSTWIEPVSTSYRGYDVWELPPNGQGIAALQMLNIIEGFDVKKMGYGSADAMHLFIEAKKLAFEDRARFYGDMEFSRIPVKQLISKSYADERRKLLDMAKSAPAYEPGEPDLRSDTIYMTVADAKGNMVSLIQSNYRGMGSGMTPTGLGFCLQDRGEGFNISEPGHPNYYAPHKRPFHTIIPGFVTKDGQPWFSFGVMGGDMQPQGHVQVLMNIIDHGMNLQEAGDAPRIYHTGSTEPNSPARMTDGGTANLERSFAPEVLDELKKRGHTLGRTGAGAFGGYQAILWNSTNRTFTGATEMRKDGQAAGY